MYCASEGDGMKKRWIILAGCVILLVLVTVCLIVWTAVPKHEETGNSMGSGMTEKTEDKNLIKEAEDGDLEAMAGDKPSIEGTEDGELEAIEEDGTSTESAGDASKENTSGNLDEAPIELPFIPTE